jgi:AcrR family transcriptional regulator
VTYVSPKRAAQKADTRRDVVEAARRLFASRGFPATTVADIAAEAGVSTQTVYGAFGGKAGLIGELVDQIDRDSDVPALAERLRGSEDPDEVLELAVRIPRSVIETSGDLIRALASAASTDEAAASALAEGRRRHDGGLRGSAEQLARLGALREDVDLVEAGAAFAALTGDQSFAVLTERHGWDLDTCERWMRETLRTLYLR